MGNLSKLVIIMIFLEEHLFLKKILFPFSKFLVFLNFK